MTSQSSLSLLVANQQLLELRKQARQRSAAALAVCDDGVQKHILSEASPDVTMAAPDAVPWNNEPVQALARIGTENGHSWEIANAQALIAQYQKRDGLSVPNTTVICDQPANKFAPIVTPEKDQKQNEASPDISGYLPAGNQNHLPLYKERVRHYPSLGTAALQAQDVPQFRVWLMCRFLDRYGRGWLNMKQVQDKLTSKNSPLRICGRRRLKQILGQGSGRYWERDRDGRLWLYGAPRVAAALEVERLAGRPVAMPVTAIMNGIGNFKAHLYAAWHSGRKTDNPITRREQKSLTGVPERTQRHYCAISGTKRQKNLAIGEKFTSEAFRERAWRHGRSVFVFADKQGWQGAKGGKYVAWHLPSTHTGPHQQLPKGRQRKVNKALTDLVTEPTQGNGNGHVDKVFFDSGKEAVRVGDKSSERERKRDAYWQQAQRSRQAGLWYVV